MKTVSLWGKWSKVPPNLGSDLRSLYNGGGGGQGGPRLLKRALLDKRVWFFTNSCLDEPVSKAPGSRPALRTRVMVDLPLRQRKHSAGDRYSFNTAILLLPSLLLPSWGNIICCSWVFELFSDEAFEQMLQSYLFFSHASLQHGRI